GEALPGLAFCAAHGGASGDDDATGLTQAAANLAVQPPPGLPGHGPLPDAWLAEFMDDEMAQHFGLVQAANMTLPQDLQNLPIKIPSTWEALRAILLKLAYNPVSANPWNVLGFGPLDGPAPTEQGIASRTRTATILCSLGQAADWDPAGRASAEAAAAHFATAGARCAEQLDEVLRERRRLRPSELPRWKELGASALQAVRAIPTCADATLATQWSQLLSNTTTDHSVILEQHRELATLLEKGDTRALEKMGGQQILAWAPVDTNALQRILAGLLRQPDPALRPQRLSLLVPIPHFPGVDSPAKLFDLWWHPLLGEKPLYISLVRAVDIILQPVEYILPGRSAPRHVRQGLASFTITTAGHRSSPTVFSPLAPLLQLPAVNSFWVDVPTQLFPNFMIKMLSPEVTNHGVSFLCRHTSRSWGSTPEVPRVCVGIILPSSLSEAGSMLAMRFLRRTVLTEQMYLGHKELYTSPDALVVECNSPLGLVRAWPLCSQAIFLSSDRVLVFTSASVESWTALLDRGLQEDENHAITNIKHKVLQVGVDFLAIRVSNDVQDSRTLPGQPSLAHSPYLGDVSVITWNTQALFAADPGRHRRKATYVRKLMATHDIGLWTETHGSNGGNEEMLDSEPSASPPRRLVLLKRAMREAAENFGFEASGPPGPLAHEDRLGVTMKFLRASEKGSAGGVSQCIQRYPILKDLVDNPYDFHTSPGRRLRLVRVHAADLARDHAIDELGRLHADLKDLSDAQAARRRHQNHRLLTRLSPGRGCSHYALSDSAGHVSTSPEHIAGVLRDHWSGVFRRRETDTTLRRTWLADEASHASLADRQCVPGVAVPFEIFERAVQHTSNSSPGPDGIPFRAWRALGGFATRALYEAFLAIASPSGAALMDSDWDSFNESSMALDKFISRAKVWRGIGCGMMLTLLAYRTYIFPVLSFLLQLDQLPSNWDVVEQQNFFTNLTNARGHLEHKAAAARVSVEALVQGDAPEPAPRSEWQKRCRIILADPRPQGAVRHLDRCLSRLQLPVLRGRRLERATLALRGLAPLAPPRVWASVYRVMCNGWTTGRRMQRPAPCAFACGHGEDSVEHYIHCSRVAEFGRRQLALTAPPPGERLSHFLLLSPRFSEDTASAIARRALAVYCVYAASTAARHGATSNAWEAMWQYELLVGLAAGCGVAQARRKRAQAIAAPSAAAGEPAIAALPARGSVTPRFASIGSLGVFDCLGQKSFVERVSADKAEKWKRKRVGSEGDSQIFGVDRNRGKRDLAPHDAAQLFTDENFDNWPPPPPRAALERLELVRDGPGSTVVCEGAARYLTALGLHWEAASMASARPGRPSLKRATSSGPTCPAAQCERNCAAPEPASYLFLAGPFVALFAGAAELLVGLAAGCGVAQARRKRARAIAAPSAAAGEPAIAALPARGPVAPASLRDALASRAAILGGGEFEEVQRLAHEGDSQIIGISRKRGKRNLAPREAEQVFAEENFGDRRPRRRRGSPRARQRLGAEVPGPALQVDQLDIPNPWPKNLAECDIDMLMIARASAMAKPAKAPLPPDVAGLARVCEEFMAKIEIFFAKKESPAWTGPIIVARQATGRHCAPPKTRLGSVGGPCEFHLSEPALQDFGGFSSAGERGAFSVCDDEAGRRAPIDSAEVACPIFRCAATGWSWAPRRAAEADAYLAGRRPRARAGIFASLAGDQLGAEDSIARFRSAAAEVGAGTRVDGDVGVVFESLGVVSDGEQRDLRRAPRPARRVEFAARALRRQRWVHGDILEIWVGHVVNLSGLLRPGLMLPADPPIRGSFRGPPLDAVKNEMRLVVNVPSAIPQIDWCWASLQRWKQLRVGRWMWSAEHIYVKEGRVSLFGQSRATCARENRGERVAPISNDLVSICAVEKGLAKSQASNSLARRAASYQVEDPSEWLFPARTNFSQAVAVGRVSFAAEVCAPAPWCGALWGLENPASSGLWEFGPVVDLMGPSEHENSRLKSRAILPNMLAPRVFKARCSWGVFIACCMVVIEPWELMESGVRTVRFMQL
ncbi:unnamed protein product, partial [Prorocentrum cordatum]